MLLKRSTPQNIVIGGAAGALPPVIGWAAVTGNVGVPALILFALVFYWTPPHFWALSLRIRKDYAAAGVPMLPVVRGIPETTRQIGLYTILMVAISLILFAVARMGPIYLAAAVVLGALFLRQAWGLWRRGDSEEESTAGAIRLYSYSISYLTLLFAAIARRYAGTHRPRMTRSAGRPTAVSAFWRRLDAPGHDAALFEPSGSGWRLRGSAAFQDERGPGSAVYEVMLDAAFVTRSGSVNGFVGTEPYDHQIARDEDGWLLDGRRVPGLAHLVDLDFGFTPATNLQQLKRVGLAVGGSAEIPVAWFDLGEDTLVELEQHYERRAANRYWYEAPTTSYEAMLELAETGFIARYPDLWEAAESPRPTRR